MDLCVIIPSAGASTRYCAAGGLRSKLDEDLGGRPVLQRTIELFTNLEETSSIVVAGPYDEYDEFVARHGDKMGLMGVKVCKGGKNHRWETVRAALDLVPEGTTHVAIHDAARPCVPLELISRVLSAAQKHDAVIPALNVPDTIKRASAQVEQDDDVDPLDAILGGAGKDNTSVRTVEETVDRTNLVLVQTPQVFTLELIRRAYQQTDLTSSDDASLVEKLGEPVHIVEGDPRNLKITRPIDLELARKVMGIGAPKERAVHKRF